MKSFISDISKKEFLLNERISGKSLRPAILKTIQQEHPDFTQSNYLALSELNVYREKYIADYLAREVGDLSLLEKTVLKAIRRRDTLSDKIGKETPEKLTLGQRLADRVAFFGGSWRFIIFFGFFLLSWIGLNIFLKSQSAFDPYPFILLNLILSCIAALQAPVIMMSQNRQDEKDRERAKQDYMVNLKSELEIRMLHEKLDHLIMHQQHELIEIQKVQIEMMTNILEKMK